MDTFRMCVCVIIQHRYIRLSISFSRFISFRLVLSLDIHLLLTCNFETFKGFLCVCVGLFVFVTVFIVLNSKALPLFCARKIKQKPKPKNTHTQKLKIASDFISFMALQWHRHGIAWHRSILKCKQYTFMWCILLTISGGLNF